MKKIHGTLVGRETPVEKHWTSRKDTMCPNKKNIIEMLIVVFFHSLTLKEVPKKVTCSFIYNSENVDENPV